MWKINDTEKIGNSGSLTCVNRLTPYVNRLHMCYLQKYGNFHYVNRLIEGINRLHAIFKRNFGKAISKWT